MTNRGASLQVDPAHSTEYKLLLPSLKPSRLQAEKEEQVMLTQRLCPCSEPGPGLVLTARHVPGPASSRLKMKETRKGYEALGGKDLPTTHTQKVVYIEVLWWTLPRSWC